MRNLSVEHRRPFQGGIRIGTPVQLIVAYCALAMIAAIVFGTLSVHPF
jgi:hypothetical protein